MNLDCCLACQGTDLHHVLMTSGFSGIGLKGAGVFESIAPVKCSVCLSCGFVAPFVDDLTLQNIRRWKKVAEKKAAEKAKKKHEISEL